MYERKRKLSQYSFLIFFILVTFLVQTVRTRINIEDIIDSNYDYLHSPVDNITGEAVAVNITIAKLSLRSVDESDLSFSVTLELWQSWTDYRLTYPSWASKEVQVLDSSWIHQLWNPKLFFRNAVDGKMDNIITPSSFFYLAEKDNRIYYCCRVILKLICIMDLKYFPHDEQECLIKMSSSIYFTKEMYLQWSHWNSDLKLYNLQQFDAKKLKWGDYTVAAGPESNISCLSLGIILKRRTGYYLINVYIPTVLIVIMSMLTFWIPPDAVPARITLGVTSLLTIITKQYQASMPSVSYIVALNVWLSSCIAFVFFSLLEFAAVIALSANSKKQENASLPHPDMMFPLVMLRSNGTWSAKNNWMPKKPDLKKKKKKKENLAPKRLDYFSRVFFPLSFIIFAVAYWFHYN